MSGLIDTTEMYLRTVYELEEEGIRPMRARIAERLGQSGPTVSQTVARLERDGLLTLQDDRHLEFTPAGRAMAVRVMRKHRLSECMLIQIIGLPWETVHAEACRWEHVMSEDVERRIVELLDHPTESPYGNPIPGLAELFDEADHDTSTEALVGLDSVAGSQAKRVTVRRIAEPVQEDSELMTALRRAGVQRGEIVSVTRSEGGIMVGSAGEYAELDDETAAHVFVAAGT